MYRIGFSEDIHPFLEGRKLYLGGVYFPNEVGLAGHSDADVVLHSVAESILGALALGDLGTLFPDNDPSTLGLDSKVIVRKAVELMKKEGYRINNIDIQVGTKRPHLNAHILEMREQIASLLETDINNVSIKAMSFNNLGVIGGGEGIKSTSVVMLIKD